MALSTIVGLNVSPHVSSYVEAAVSILMVYSVWDLGR